MPINSMWCGVGKSLFSWSKNSFTFQLTFFPIYIYSFAFNYILFQHYLFINHTSVECKSLNSVCREIAQLLFGLFCIWKLLPKCINPSRIPVDHITKREDNLGKKLFLPWVLKFHIDYHFQVWCFMKW